MPDQSEIENALVRADAAGDTEAVKMLVAELQKTQRTGLPEPDDPFGPISTAKVAPRVTQESLSLGDVASQAGEQFQAGVGERLGLDPENLRSVQRNISFLTPVVDVAAAAGDVVAGGFNALASIGGDILFKTGLTGGLGRNKIRKELQAFGEFAGLFTGVPVTAPARISATGQKLRQIPKPDIKIPSPSKAVGRIKQAADRVLVNVSIGASSPTEAANRLVDEALKLDKLDLKSIKSGNLIQEGGENVRQLARTAGSQIGESRNIIEAYKTNVVGQQFERIRRAAESSFGNKKGFFDEFEDLIKSRADNSAPLYIDAFQETVPLSKDLKGLLSRPSGRNAINRARRLSAESGESFPNIFGKGLAEGKSITVRDLDKIKRGLDDAIERFRDPVTGRLPNTNNVRSLEATRGEFLGKISDLSPTYKEARAAFSGPSQSLDFLNRGRDFSKRNPEQIKSILKNANEGDIEFYKSGVIRGLLDEMDRIGANANLVRARLTTPRFRNQIRAVFEGDEKAADTFVDQLIKERERFNRAQFVSARTGSQTQQRGESKAFFGRALDLMDLSQGSAFSVARRAASKIAGSGAGQAQQEVYDEVAKILTSEIAPR